MPSDERASFQPLPFLRNPHLQTLLATFFEGPLQSLRAVPRHVALPDGDGLVLHDSVPKGWRPGSRVALLVHGLGGCHRSGYLRRLAMMLLARGVRAVRMDLRGAGEGARHARRIYNGCCSGDVRAAAEEVLGWAPGSPLALVGISLGGNIVMKLAGEAGDNPLPGLERVAALAPPIDLERCAGLLGSCPNRFYERFFVHNLVRQVRTVQRHFPDQRRVRFPRGLTLHDFDDIYTAPRAGFAGAADYYRRAAALPLMGRIRVPALIVAARDDPFIAVQTFEALPALPGLELRITRHGGHLGFLGRDGGGGIRWAERQIVDWLTDR